MKNLLLSTILILIFVCAKKDKTEVRYLDLPEEFMQMSKGDTMMIGNRGDTIKIEFYKAKNGIVANNYLYIVK